MKDLRLRTTILKELEKDLDKFFYLLEFSQKCKCKNCKWYDWEMGSCANKEAWKRVNLPLNPTPFHVASDFGCIYFEEKNK